jgi:hypothetical protein
MEIIGCLEPWFYGTFGSSEPWFYGTLGSSDSWVFGTLVPSDLRNPGVTLPLDPRTLGYSEPWFYCTLESSESWFYGFYGFMVPLDLRTLRILLAPLVLRGVPLPPPPHPGGMERGEGDSPGGRGGRQNPRGSLGCLLRVVWFFGYFLSRMARTLVAVSAPLVMPLRDSDIPMKVPFTFRNKQSFPPKP